MGMSSVPLLTHFNRSIVMSKNWKAMERRIAKTTEHQKVGELASAIAGAPMRSGEQVNVFKALMHTVHNLKDRYDMDFDRAAHVIRPICAKLKYGEYHLIEENLVLISLPNSGILIIAVKPYNDRLIPVSALTLDMYIKESGVTVRLALSTMEFKGKGSKLLKQQLKEFMEE